MTIKLASEPGFEQFVSKKRTPDTKHGWTVRKLLPDGQHQDVFGTWSVYANRKKAQWFVDRLNGLNTDEREVVGLVGKAVLAYYSERRSRKADG